MSALAFDFYAEDDPFTLLGTLDDIDCKAMEFRVALQELGAGKFTISRHHPLATSALIRENNLVKVRIPSVDTDPIFAFWLKEGEFVLLDSDEEGGEDLTFGGPGFLYILRLARLRGTPYAPGQPQLGGRIPNVPGQWTWDGEPYGAILTRIIEEGQNMPGEPLADVEIDFSRLLDSDGIGWPTIDDTFQTPIGSDVLAVADRIAAAGDLFMVHRTPMNSTQLVIEAYQSYGRDLTGAFASDTVRFEKGVNILTQLVRRIEARDMLTHLIINDMDNVRHEYVWNGYSAGDRAHYGYVEAGQTNDAGLLQKIADHTIAASRSSGEQIELEATPGFDPTNGRYMPGPPGTSGHFWVGDLVTLHTGSGEHEYDAENQVVVAIRVVLDEAADDSTSDTAARSLHIVPELNYNVVRGFGDVSPGYCCGPVAPAPGTPSTGGETELVCWDWETGNETVPAIPSLSMPSGTVTRSGPHSWGYYYAFFDNTGSTSSVPRGTDNLAFAAPAAGDQIRIDWTSHAGSTQSVLGIEWITGDYTDWTGSSIASFVDSTELVKQWNNGGSGGAPISHSEVVTVPAGGITAFRLRSNAGGAGGSPASTTWNLDALCLTTLSSTPAVPGDGNPDAFPDGPSTGVYAPWPHTHWYYRDRAPGATDDTTKGYRIGERWVNTATLEEWRLDDATEDAAVWTPTVDDSETPAALSVISHGAMGATEEFDASAGMDHEATLTENVTITLVGATDGFASWMTLLLTDDGSGPYTITWPAEVLWPGGVEPDPPAAGEALAVSLFTYDGGTTWYGSLQASGGALDVTDDTTTVTSVTALEFDPADFDVTDEGGGTARVAFVGSASGSGLPLTAVVDGEPVLVWDENNSLIASD